MNQMLKSGVFWIIIFSLIQGLALLIITQSDSSISGFLGFPNWLLCFFGLELLFSFSFYFFIKHYWSLESLEE